MMAGEPGSEMLHIVRHSEWVGCVCLMYSMCVEGGRGGWSGGLIRESL